MKDQMVLIADKPAFIPLWLTIIAAIVGIVGYVLAIRKPNVKKYMIAGRAGFIISALSTIGSFSLLGYHVFNRHYIYDYVFRHTGNELTGWYRLAATWSGQEGSFALWACLTAVIGLLVIKNGGRYEARVAPFYVTILAFLAAILIKQSPFMMIPPPSAEIIKQLGQVQYPMIEGLGLNPSLNNYWMTIHPPTIFFGFASLSVPFVYSIAALIWKDYEGWTPRVMPYALLSSATLGGGLFMGGYWAYETQGWHGFWAWDPVENASFFPWLAVTALVHGLVVQKNRGGMARTNTFLGILTFTLFLIGTFLTRSGALASKDQNGVLMSVHAFANLESSALFFLVAMLVIYGLGGLVLWCFRLKSMPRRKTTGDTLISRDFAMYMSVLLMLAACLIVTLGTTTPLWRSWFHMSMWQPQASFYNKVLIPLSLVASLFMGFAPWVAWRKTGREKFLQRLTIPWFAMIAFGFFMAFWAMAAQSGMEAIYDPSDEALSSTMAAWNHSRVLQRLTVVSLASLGFFAALSNSMLAYRVFRAKPLSAGGWLAHVGMGLLILGAVVSSTYERTQMVTLIEGEAPKDVFGYKLSFEKMTGKSYPQYPFKPNYDPNNTVQLRVAPQSGTDAGAADGSKTFTVEPKWFVHNINRVQTEAQFENQIWPSITKYWGHDLYIGLAGYPEHHGGTVTVPLGGSRQVGNYTLTYEEQVGQPGKYMGAKVTITTPEGKVITKTPIMVFGEGGVTGADNDIPELPDADGNPSEISIQKIDPATKTADIEFSAPGLEAGWIVPVAVTFKPWVNLVWTGVVIAVLGTFLAMFRRIFEARKINDDKEGDVPTPELNVYDLPEEGINSVIPHVTPVASPIVATKSRKLRPTGK